MPELSFKTAEPLSLTEVRLGIEEGFGPDSTKKEISVGSIRSSHHFLARQLAKGSRVTEIAAMTGFSPQRISDLQQSPAFAELVATYSKEVDAAFANTVQRIELLSRDAIEEMQERLLERPQEFSNDELLKLATAMLDRSGNGPSSTTHVQHGLDSVAIDAMKQRVALAQGTVIDAQSSQPVNERQAATELPEGSLGAGAKESEGRES